jgi:tetratricopeptide (TPR) repeat protein
MTQRSFGLFVLLLMGAVASTGCGTSSEEYYQRGTRALAAGNLDVASEALHRSIEKDPHRGGAYLALARIYLRDENWLLASNALREAARLDPRLRRESSALLQDALYQTALQQLRLGDKRAAIAAFRELYQKSPDYPNLREAYLQALTDYGRERIVLGDFGEGVQALKEALRIDPKNVAARRLLRRIRFSAK